MAGPPTMLEQYATKMLGFPLLQGFTVDGARMLLESGKIATYVSGDMLFRERDPALFTQLVLEGKLQVFIEREGRELVLTELGPGTYWVNWESYAISRAPPRRGRWSLRPLYFGVPPNSGECWFETRCCRTASWRSRCAP